MGALGAILGEVLVEQGPPELFARVEQARGAARRRREGDAEAEAELAALLQRLPPGEALEVVRAFSSYFGLVNLAERVHRIRRRASYRAADAPPQPGSLEAVLRGLKDEGMGPDEVTRALARCRIAPVFTAHPTEAVRRSLLTKGQRIARTLLARLIPGREELPLGESAVESIREEVTTAWQTEEQLSVRPSVVEEVEHVLFFLTDVIYEAVPLFHEDLERAVARVYGEDAGITLPGAVLEFASWVGGDMDGNPNVGAETIRATLGRHVELVLGLYRRDLEELFELLSHSRSRVEVDPACLERIEDYRARLPGARERTSPRHHEMPYRVLLDLIIARLEVTQEGAGDGYAGPCELLEDLRLIEGSLLSNRGEHSGLRPLGALIRRVQTFGFHLATLDVRQDARVHRGVAAQLLGIEGLADLESNERVRLFEEALASPPAPPPRGLDEEAEETLEVLRAIREGREQHGVEAIGPYIISMAQGPDDALAVLLLARAAGLVDPEGQVPLDVAPLFETVDDLAQSEQTFRSMLGNPSYRRHLEARGQEQTVMLGYSDSNKDSGLAASRWALQQAQARLVAAAAELGVTPVFFHGRGGSVSRGGGKTRNAVLAAPPGAVNGRLRLTEQGETIHASYGLGGIALRTLEQATGAVLERSARDAIAVAQGGGGGVGEGADPEWEAVATAIAQRGRSTYRALVYEDPGFHDYFRGATPIDVIERLCIGSRPSSRRTGSGVEDLRAIPWVFAWTQSRQILPGWYGTGAGLEAAIEAHGIDLMRRLAREWPFITSLLSDACMVLAKTDMAIAKHYAELASPAAEPIFDRILGEHDRTCSVLREILETPDLLAHDPVLERSIGLRNPYVDPISFIQVDALRRWRATGREDPELERLLAGTVRGIARGLQNTG